MLDNLFQVRVRASQIHKTADLLRSFERTNESLISSWWTRNFLHHSMSLQDQTGLKEQHSRQMFLF